MEKPPVIVPGMSSALFLYATVFAPESQPFAEENAGISRFFALLKNCAKSTMCIMLISIYCATRQ
jgi:hypothetical protein